MSIVPPTPGELPAFVRKILADHKVTQGELAKFLGYATTSGLQNWLKPSRKTLLPAKKIIDAVARPRRPGSPPITNEELWALAGRPDPDALQVHPFDASEEILRRFNSPGATIIAEILAQARELMKDAERRGGGATEFARLRDTIELIIRTRGEAFQKKR